MSSAKSKLTRFATSVLENETRRTDIACGETAHLRKKKSSSERPNHNSKLLPAASTENEFFAKSSKKYCRSPTSPLSGQEIHSGYSSFLKLSSGSSPFNGGYKLTAQIAQGSEGDVFFGIRLFDLETQLKTKQEIAKCSNAEDSRREEFKLNNPEALQSSPFGKTRSPHVAIKLVPMRSNAVRMHVLQELRVGAMLMRKQKNLEVEIDQDQANLRADVSASDHRDIARVDGLSAPDTIVQLEDWFFGKGSNAAAFKEFVGLFFFSDCREVGIVMERCEFSLDDFVRSVGEAREAVEKQHSSSDRSACNRQMSRLPGAYMRISQGEVARVLSDISEALSFLHANGLVHCDIKTENIVWGAKGGGVWKLCDFGSSRFLRIPSETENAEEQDVDFSTQSKRKKMFDRLSSTPKRRLPLSPSSGSKDGGRGALAVGTLWTAAPEVLRLGLREAKPAADIWSLGCVLWETCYLSKPFVSRELLAYQNDLSVKLTLDDRAKQLKRLPWVYDKKLLQVLKRNILIEDVTKRLTASELLHENPVTKDLCSKSECSPLFHFKSRHLDPECQDDPILPSRYLDEPSPELSARFFHISVKKHREKGDNCVWHIAEQCEPVFVISSAIKKTQESGRDRKEFTSANIDHIQNLKDEIHSILEKTERRGSRKLERVHTESVDEKEVHKNISTSTPNADKDSSSRAGSRKGSFFSFFKKRGTYPKDASPTLPREKEVQSSASVKPCCGSPELPHQANLMSSRPQQNTEAGKDLLKLNSDQSEGKRLSNKGSSKKTGEVRDRISLEHAGPAKNAKKGNKENSAGEGGSSAPSSASIKSSRCIEDEIELLIQSDKRSKKHDGEDTPEKSISLKGMVGTEPDRRGRRIEKKQTPATKLRQDSRRLSDTSQNNNPKRENQGPRRSSCDGVEKLESDTRKRPLLKNNVRSEESYDSSLASSAQEYSDIPAGFTELRDPEVEARETQVKPPGNQAKNFDDLPVSQERSPFKLYDSLETDDRDPTKHLPERQHSAAEKISSTNPKLKSQVHGKSYSEENVFARVKESNSRVQGELIEHEINRRLRGTESYNERLLNRLQDSLSPEFRCIMKDVVRKKEKNNRNSVPNH